MAAVSPVRCLCWAALLGLGLAAVLWASQGPATALSVATAAPQPALLRPARPRSGARPAAAASPAGPRGGGPAPDGRPPPTAADAPRPAPPARRHSPLAAPLLAVVAGGVLALARAALRRWRLRTSRMWSMATLAADGKAGGTGPRPAVVGTFQKAAVGDLDPAFQAFLSPTLQEDFQQVVEGLGTEPPATHGLFGLELRTVPGVYAPGVQSTSVFLLRAMVTAGGRWPALLELGCGSGAVGLTLRHRGACDRLVLTDIFAPAVEVAAANAQQLPPAARDSVRVLQSDMFQQVPAEQFDAVVFNMPLLHKPSVDPREIAYSDVSGGLARRFFAEADAFLAPGGEIWFSYSNVSDPAILREAGAKWAFQLVLAELKAANGMWKFAYRGTLR
eukprot:EG_transcript_14184